MTIFPLRMAGKRTARLLLPVFSLLAMASAEDGRDYVVFVGLNVGVERGGAFLPVVGADRGTVEVLRNGVPETVAMRDLRDFTTRTEPKISTTSLEVTDLNGVRAYTTANDPTVMGMQQQSVLMDMQASQENQAEIALRNSLGTLQALQRAAQSGLPVSPDEIARAETAANSAASNLSAAAADSTSGAFSGANPAGAADKGLFDAYEVSFRVSAPRRIERAYALLRLILRDPNQPGTPASTLRFFPLPVIDTKARKVTLTLRGLPPGFSADAHELHVFVGNEEIATSVSSHRYEVTAPEAHQFLLLQYLDKNKRATIPVGIVTELLPSGLAALIPDPQRSLTVNFSVDADGRVTDVTWPAGSSAPSPELDAALRALPFYPALLEGKPTASTGTFALSEFLR